MIRFTERSGSPTVRLSLGLATMPEYVVPRRVHCAKLTLASCLLRLLSVAQLGYAQTPTPTPVTEPIAETHLQIDFAVNGNAAGWVSDVSFGIVTPEVTAEGLCLFTPPGDDVNVGEWGSPRAAAIELTPNSVYRVRFTMTADQSDFSNQQAWWIKADNRESSGDNPIWETENLYWANAGGANSVRAAGGAVGLNEFEAWIAPISVQTDAWNGIVDPENSPFSPANQDAAAFNIRFQVGDAVGFSLTSEDSGTICLQAVRVDRFHLSNLVEDGPPVFGSTTRVPSEMFAVTVSASGSISVPSSTLVGLDHNAGVITIQLDEPPAAGPGPGEEGVGRAFVQFVDAAQPVTSFLRLFPVPWNDGELLRLTAEIRATGVPSNPVDQIFLAWQTATQELLAFHSVFRGAPGGPMDRASSPRPETVANSTYTSFFYTHNSTAIDLALLPDANRLRGVIDLINRTDLAGALGEGNLSDPLEIRSFAVHRVTLTGEPPMVTPTPFPTPVPTGTPGPTPTPTATPTPTPIPEVPVLQILDPSGEVSFGAVDVDAGPSDVQTITLQNVGMGALEFGPMGIELGGANLGDFAIQGMVLLDPLFFNESRDVNLIFDPTAVGARTAELVITTNDPASPVQTVVLRGTGGRGPRLITEGGAILNPAGPTLTLSFDQPISIDAPLISAQTFSLPVEGDGLGGLGFGATVGSVNSTDLILSLGSENSLTVAGEFSTSQTIAGSASGIGLATSLAPGAIFNELGLDAVAGGETLNILVNLVPSGPVVIDSALGGEVTLGDEGSSDAAYTKHSLSIAPNSISTAPAFGRAVRLTPDGGGQGAFVFQFGTPQGEAADVPGAVAVTSDAAEEVTFDPPAFLTVEYRDDDIVLGGRFETGMRIHQWVEPPGEWVLVEGEQTVDPETNTVTVTIPRVDPSGQTSNAGTFAALSLPLITLDFARDGNEDAGWEAPFVSSLATVSDQPGEGTLAGLCINTPASGDNFGLWGPSRADAIPLVANSVYRIRFQMSTDQMAGAAQPLWNILVDNLDPTTGMILWGMERWFFSNTEFANAIGNTAFDGLIEFDAWVVPNAVTTDAWNGVVDPENSPFDAANKAAASFNIKFRVLDLDSAIGINAGQDFGTVCLRSIQIDRFALADLMAEPQPIWGSASSMPPKINILPFAFDGASVVASMAQVLTDEITQAVTILLDEPSPAPDATAFGRAFVQFEDTDQPETVTVGAAPNTTVVPNLLRFFPVPWNDGELLRLTSEIRALQGADTKPVDVIALGWETATDELGGTDFTFRGAPGGTMDRAGSPRDDSVANSTYTSFFYTHHSTDVDLLQLPNANRLRGVLDFFNRTDLAGTLGAGNLSDPFEIRSMAIHRITYDEAVFGPRPAE